MKQPVMVLILLVVALGVGGVLLASQRNNSAPAANKSTNQLAPTGQAVDMQKSTTSGQVEDSAVQEDSTKYTLADISIHNTADDCWFAIEGDVYDVTEFIASQKHPGKDAIIQGCGKDATTLFNTRPMGSGTPHSDKARSFLPNYKIGVLMQ